MEVSVKGPDDIHRLVRQINQHADKKALNKELRSGLNRVSKDIRGQMVEAIPAALPRRGGLAELVRGATRSRTSIKGGKWAGVSMAFSARGHDIRTLTGRRLRHPVFGNRSAWVDQDEGLQPAAWLQKFEDQKPEIQRAIVRVMEDVARKVTDI